MTTPELKVSIGYASDKGIKTDNEDFFGSLIPQDSQLVYKGITAAIADGMSGSDAGKEASHCCVISFLSDYYSTPDSWSGQASKYDTGWKTDEVRNDWRSRFGISRDSFGARCGI